MLQSEPELMMIAEYLRLIGDDYVTGKDKIEGWKKEFTALSRELKKVKEKTTREYRIRYSKRNRLLNSIERFFDAEDFWFDDPENGVNEFFEKYKLNLLDWDVEFFKRKVREGKINTRAEKRSENVNNTRTEPLEREEVFSSYDRQRGMFGGCNRAGITGIGSGNRPPVVRRAVALAGCVC